MAQYRVVDKTTFKEIGTWTKEKIEAGVSNKVDKEQGKSLVADTDVTQITTNKTDIASLKSGKADKSQLTGLATETYVDGKVENLGDLKGSCLKSELEDKKAECKANDMYIVTDDDNHIYFYNGTDWTDTSAKAHVDLSNYYDKSTIDSKFVEKVSGSSLITSAQLQQITTNQTNITSLQTGKVDKVSGKDLVATADITQITTNKNNISSLQTSLSTIESDLSTLATALTEMV